MKTNQPFYLKAIVLLLICFAPYITFAQNGFSKLPAPNISGVIRCMASDTAYNLWVTATRQIAKYNGTGWTVYDTTFTRYGTRCLAIDQSTNMVWLGTSKGLVSFNGSTWTNYNTANSGMLNDTTYSICAKNGLVYAGSPTGISVFDGSKWTTFTSTNSGLPLANIYSLAVQNNGAVWAGSDSGRIAYYYKGNWKLYDTLDGIPNWPIKSIALDKNERVWFSAPYLISPPFSGMLTRHHVYTLQNGKALGANEFFNNCAEKITTPNSNGYSLVTDASGNIWAGAVPNLFELSANKVNTYNYTGDTVRYDNLNNSYISYIAPAKNDLIYAFITTDERYRASFYIFDKTKYNNRIGNPAAYDPQFNQLDINKVKARITNRGDMFWDLVSHPQYEVPKGECKNAIFANALWIGGYEHNNLHLAAMTYRQSGSDFFPGPLDTITAKGDTARSRHWDKIWKVNRYDIEKFKTMYANGSVANGTYKIPADIMNWPAHGDATYHEAKYLAPFVDVNSDGYYNPLQGDYPEIKGDQALFWIFNDNTNIHSESEGDALGIEVHAMAYAYNCDSIPENDSAQALNYTTFYHYKIINRSKNTYDSTRVGVWESSEMGNWKDDRLGCDPKENISFVYNADNYDETPFGYGSNPPMLSYLLLDGHPAENDGKDNDNDGVTDEAGEKMLMNKYLAYYNDFTNAGNPSEAAHFYRYLSGRWRNNAPVTFGKDGTDTALTPTNFMFPDNPYDTSVAKWSQKDIRQNNWTQYTSVMSSGGFSLAPNAETNFEYAIIYSRDETAPNGTNTSLKKNYQYVHAIRNFYENQSFPSCTNNAAAIKPVNINQSVGIYPNPATTSFYLDYSTNNLNCHYQLIDAQGRIIQQGSYATGDEIGIKALNKGLYILQLNDNGKILRGVVNKL